MLWLARPVSAQFVHDTFTDTDGDDVVAAHTGETGATWAKVSGVAGTMEITDANRARLTPAIGARLYASGTGATAEYDITAVFEVKSVIASGNTGVCGRATTNSDTGYCVIYEVGNTQWEFWEVVSGTYTSLGNCEANPLAAGTYTVTLSLRDALKTADITGCSQISHSATNDITAAGRVVILSGSHTPSDTTGIHIDSITASNPSTGPVTRMLLTGAGK